MNIERLSEIAEAINADFKNTTAIQRVATIVAALNQIMSEPTPTNEQKLLDALTAFKVSLGESKVSTFPRTWRPYLEEIGITSLLGESLKQRVVDIVERRGITQAAAKEELQAIINELTQYQNAFQKLLESVDMFGFSQSTVEPGMAEVSFLFPMTAFDGRMSTFGRNVEFFDKAIGFFTELGTGSREEAKMYQLSNPEPLVMVGITLLGAMPLLKFVDQVLTVIERTYKLREARANALKAEADKAVIDALDENIQARIDAGVTDIKKALFAEYKPEKTRKNELDVLADKILPRLADMIDHGYQIDGDAYIEEDEQTLPEGEAPSKESQDKKALVAELKTLSRQIRYHDVPESPVLLLAPPKEEEEGGAEAERG